MTSEADDTLTQAAAWLDGGHAVALATVIGTWGSSPRPVGSHLAVADDGRFSGSVSGGCIEGAVVTEALEVLTDGAPRVIEFGVSDERAWEVGLSCGGTIRLLVERADVPDGLLRHRTARQAVALVTRLADGARVLVDETDHDGELPLDEGLLAQVRAALVAGRSELLPGDALFVRSYVPTARLVVVGAVHIAQHLVAMAANAGFAVTLVDPRTAFATAERFPGAEISREWPDRALQRLAPDATTAVVTLSHDPKLDDPSLAVALASDAFYVGALGSRRTHAKRVERLRELGLGDRVERIHAPIGLDLGGRSAVEIAVAILAEIIQVRHRKATG